MNRIPSRAHMKGLLTKPNSTYYKILNIRKSPIPLQPIGITYLRRWLSVFLTGMSKLHESLCLKFYLSMSIICRIPTTIRFTAVSSWILIRVSLLTCFPTARNRIFSIISVILNMKRILMKLTPVSWIASNMFPSICLNRFDLSFSHTARRPSSVRIVSMSFNISPKILMQFD